MRAQKLKRLRKGREPHLVPLISVCEVVMKIGWVEHTEKGNFEGAKAKNSKRGESTTP